MAFVPFFSFATLKKEIQNTRLYYGDAISFRAFKQKLSLRRLLHYDKDIFSKM